MIAKLLCLPIRFYQLCISPMLRADIQLHLESQQKPHLLRYRSYLPQR